MGMNDPTYLQARIDATEALILVYEEALEAMAATEGIQSYTFDSVDRLPDDLPRGRQVPIESLPPKPLWNRWPVVLLFLTLLVGEWILRKLGSMV